MMIRQSSAVIASCGRIRLSSSLYSSFSALSGGIWRMVKKISHQQDKYPEFMSPEHICLVLKRVEKEKSTNGGERRIATVSPVSPLGQDASRLFNHERKERFYG